jgi:hypothetical protein
MSSRQTHSKYRVTNDSFQEAAHEMKKKSSDARPEESRKAMYWESVALMSIGVAD